MKINTIRIQHFLGIQHINLTLDRPVTLFAGRNGSGKSCIAEAVRFALVGEHDREHLKKNFKHMVTEGQKDGLIDLTITDDDETAVGVLVDVASGRRKHSLTDNQFLPFVLDPNRFASMDVNERRTLLFDLTGCRATGDEVRRRLIEQDCDEKKVERIIPLLRSGFEAAHKEAATMARESKACWRAVTEESYGDKKAETWKAEKPEIDESMAAALNDEPLGKIESSIKAGMERIGSLKTKHNQIKALPTAIHELTEQVDTIGRLEKTVEIQASDIKQYQKELKAIKEKASGIPAPEAFHCPACDAELMFHIDELKLYKFNGKECDKEAQEVLPRREEGLRKLQRAHGNTIKRLTEARAANAKIKEIEQQIKDAPNYGKDIAQLQTELSALEGKARALRRKCDEAKAAHRAAEEADQKTRSAAAHHLDVTAWLRVADTLAPDGIPAEILSGALQPVNELLSDSAKITGWKIPLIDGNIEIEADGRPYRLLSESEKWRVDAMIAEAISKLSGLKMIALDRFDVLDLPSRSRLIVWLSKLAQAGEFETCLLFGTLKGLPGKLPEGVDAHWIENGGIATQQEAA